MENCGPLILCRGLNSTAQANRVAALLPGPCSCHILPETLYQALPRNMIMGKTTKEISKRKMHIMDATLELVSSVGLLRTTISKISEQVKCSPGIVYHHFKSKEEIVNLLYESIFEEMMDYVVSDNDQAHLFLERFKGLWIRTYDYHLNNPMKTVFLEQFKNSSYYTEEMEAVTAKHLKVFMEMGKADIEAGNIAMLPFEVIQAMTWDVAKNLARAHAKAGVRLDESTLDMVAARSCSSVTA